MKYKRPDGTEGEWSPMEALLVKQSLNRASSSAGLQAQIAAVQQLVDRGSEVPVGRIRAELEFAATDPFGTSRSGYAARAALRLLAVMDGLPDDTDRFEGIWRSPHIDPDQRRSWVETEFVADAAVRLGWRLDFEEYKAGSARLSWLLAEAHKILSEPDDERMMDLADAWLTDPPQPPANVPRGAVLVPDVGYEQLLGEDDYDDAA